MCITAYRRDSRNGSDNGPIQPAIAASPAFAFHTVTAFGIAAAAVTAGDA